MNESRVAAQTLKGFQDVFPPEMIARHNVIEAIRAVYERFGFLPIDTPAAESREVLLGAGGEETNKEIFQFESPEGDPIALRFDLTVPFARLIAQYRQQIKLPFRRYHLGTVWRADKPGPGRFRQFTQFDIDIAGAGGIAADAEVIAAMCAAMRSLGLARLRGPDGALTQGFQVRISDRRLVDALLEGNGITEPARLKHVLRVMDKLQKVGLENVRRELGGGRVDDSGDPIPGVGLPPELIDKICAFVGVKSGTRRALVEALTPHLPANEQSARALDGMRELAGYLDAFGVDEAEAIFDPSLTRGLDYYTGPVFETCLPTAAEFGSVGGGGRYDDLCGRFLDEKVPATGISIGVDRLMAALAHLGVTAKTKSTVQVCVAAVGKVERAEVLKVGTELRGAGFNTLTYLGDKKSMSAQLSDADRYEVPIAVILGEDELARGEVAVKDLVAGKQRREGIADRDDYRHAGTATQVTVPRKAMVETVRVMLETARRAAASS